MRVYPLNDVQQAGEVVRVAALSEVHQQLSGLFSDSQVPIFSYPTELGDHHHFNQLILEQDKEENKRQSFILLNFNDLYIGENIHQSLTHIT